MPFQLSPGVNVTEIDLTTVVPAVASSDGAIAGIFNWGPVGQRVLIDSETKLVSEFGKPSNNNAETWFTAANFLSYSNRLYVVRAANTTALDSANGAWNAIANTGSANIVAQVVRNSADFQTHAAFDTDVQYVAKYPGKYGNSLRISVCDTPEAYSSVLQANGLVSVQANDVSAALSISIGSNTANLIVSAGSGGDATAANSYCAALVANLAIGDILTLGNNDIGIQYSKITSIGSVVAGATTIGFEDTYKLATNFATNSSINTTISRYWEFHNVVDGAPSQTEYQAMFGNTAAVDGLHVVIVDDGGKFTGTPGSILETYTNLSRATDGKTATGGVNYYQTVLNNTSKYVWAVNDRSLAVSNTAVSLTSSTKYNAYNINFRGGTDGFAEDAPPLSVVTTAYDQFSSAEDVDISLILAGKPLGGTTTSGGQTVENFQLANYIIDNICENRKDCVVFVSPDDAVVTSNYNNEATSSVNWRNALHDSSYAVIDSGYKYQYDRYNDVYRYVPMNGDIAGLCARTDNNRDPWWSPAGFNRGQIKNLVKLRWNPRKADRDILYKNGINPIVTFPGQGTVLYGDKTLQSKPSAFDRINVRRLFIVLEKAISTASKFTLFEFNDEFTRAQFKNLVTPYLRDVKGRRGITDFLVVCDSTNNTPERVDRNEFWGDIYIKPARSINFIQLNFVAVRSGVQFSEIVGKF